VIGPVTPQAPTRTFLTGLAQAGEVLDKDLPANTLLLR
jgi:hypothetical protein